MLIHLVMMPRSPDLAIFLTTDVQTYRQTIPIPLPLAHACGVIILSVKSAIKNAFHCSDTRD